MKLFLIERNADYDEYEATVLIAESFEQAKEIIKTGTLPDGSPMEYEEYGDSKITEIKLDEPKEVWASFYPG